MRLILAICCALLLPACAMTKSTFAPDSYHTLDKDIADLRALFGPATNLDRYYDGTAETEAKRNEFIAKRIALYDLEYQRFVQTLRLGRAQVATLFDHTSLGLGLATTLVAGEHTKTVLGAVTTAITGSRASFEKNFYADQTTNALIGQMGAERKEVLVRILDGSRRSIAEYPMFRAIADLGAYREAGTIGGALIGVQNGAAAKDFLQSAKIAQYRTGAYKPDDSSNRIMQWLYPGSTTFDQSGVAHAADGAVVNLVQANWDKLEEEIDRQGFDGLPVEAFLDDARFAPARTEAIGKLSIP